MSYTMQMRIHFYKASRGQLTDYENNNNESTNSTIYKYIINTCK